MATESYRGFTIESGADEMVRLYQDGIYRHTIRVDLAHAEIDRYWSSDSPETYWRTPPTLPAR
jgi:hypothetical protein